MNLIGQNSMMYESEINGGHSLAYKYRTSYIMLDLWTQKLPHLYLAQPLQLQPAMESHSFTHFSHLSTPRQLQEEHYSRQYHSKLDQASKFP